MCRLHLWSVYLWDVIIICWLNIGIFQCDVTIKTLCGDVKQFDRNKFSNVELTDNIDMALAVPLF